MTKDEMQERITSQTTRIGELAEQNRKFYAIMENQEQDLKELRRRNSGLEERFAQAMGWIHAKLDLMPNGHHLPSDNSEPGSDFPVYSRSNDAPF